MSDSNSIVSLDKPNVSHDEGELDHAPLTKRATVCGDHDEFVMLGDKRYLRHELMYAFGGRVQSERVAPAPVHQFGNASALAMFSFGLNSFLLGLYGLHAKGVKEANVAVGMMFFCGGLLQFLSGIWEFFVGNTFAVFSMCSFGSFYISLGATYAPSFGVLEAYFVDLEQLPQALGFFFLGWAITGFMCLILLLRSTIPLVLLFVFVTLDFAILAAAEFTGSTGANRVSSVFSLLVGFTGFYNGFAGVANTLNSYIILPVLPVPW